MSTTRQRDRIQSIKVLLRKWYAARGRRLPWRGIPNPYRILVSEIMLQQTQVHRVLTLYPVFIKRYPTFTALARAQRSDVIVAWKGLGYNNRAVRLHELAKIVTTTYGGQLPDSEETLRSLPGIGRYTANALISSVHHRRVPIVDINVRRVYSRLLWHMPYWNSMRKEEEIWEVAAQILPAKKTYEWNQALMDLGAMICSARRPRCTDCPLASQCCSAMAMRPSSRQATSTEKKRYGIPHRIYRGRIIDALRGKPSLTAHRIGEIVLPGYTPADEGWLQQLLEGLRRDGLIVVHLVSGRCRVALA